MALVTGWDSHLSLYLKVRHFSDITIGCLVRRAVHPDEHIFISFSLSVHEAMLELRTKLKIDIKSLIRFVQTPTNERIKYELPR
jgi:hypothetical protein